MYCRYEVPQVCMCGCFWNYRQRLDKQTKRQLELFSFSPPVKFAKKKKGHQKTKKDNLQPMPEIWIINPLSSCVWDASDREGMIDRQRIFPDKSK